MGASSVLMTYPRTQLKDLLAVLLDQRRLLLHVGVHDALHLSLQLRCDLDIQPRNTTKF